MTPFPKPDVSCASRAGGPRMSSRKDVRSAEKAIGEYARVIGGAFDDTQSLLNRALTATFIAVSSLQKDPDLLADFLEPKQPGPVSGNPIKPIVRKLWKGVPTRDTVHRYASCIGLAQREGVKPGEFSEWLSALPGGIKAATARFARIQKKPEERIKAALDLVARRNAALSRFHPIPLPSEIGCRQQGLYLGALRVSADGNAEMLAVFDDLTGLQVDAMIIRALR